MSSQLKDIQDKALSLSPNERESLVHSLIDSLENSPITDIDEAWIIEAEKRYDRYKKGLTEEFPGREFFQRFGRNWDGSKKDVTFSFIYKRK